MGPSSGILSDSDRSAMTALSLQRYTNDLYMNENLWAPPRDDLNNDLIMGTNTSNTHGGVNPDMGSQSCQMGQSLTQYHCSVPCDELTPVTCPKAIVCPELQCPDCPPWHCPAVTATTTI